jgi:hypothetical protein
MNAGSASAQRRIALAGARLQFILRYEGSRQKRGAYGISAGPHCAVRKSRVRRARPLAPRRNGAGRALLELQFTASQRAAAAAHALPDAAQAAHQLSPPRALSPRGVSGSCFAFRMHALGIGVADLVAAPSSPQPSCVVECRSTRAK